MRKTNPRRGMDDRDEIVTRAWQTANERAFEGEAVYRRWQARDVRRLRPKIHHLPK